MQYGPCHAVLYFLENLFTFLNIFRRSKSFPLKSLDFCASFLHAIRFFYFFKRSSLSSQSPSTPCHSINLMNLHNNNKKTKKKIVKNMKFERKKSRQTDFGEFMFLSLVSLVFLFVQTKRKTLQDMKTMKAETENSIAIYRQRKKHQSILMTLSNERHGFSRISFFVFTEKSNLTTKCRRCNIRFST